MAIANDFLLFGDFHAAKRHKHKKVYIFYGLTNNNNIC